MASGNPSEDTGFLYPAVVRALELGVRCTFAPLIPATGARPVDCYLVIWLLVEGAVSCLAQFGFISDHTTFVVMALIVLGDRVLDICCVLLLVLFRGWWRIPDACNSAARGVCLVMINYIELVVIFACAHFILDDRIVCYLNEPLANMGDAIYFSIVTMSTLGFGDFMPTHTAAKALVAIQVPIGGLIVITAIARFIGSLAKLREVGQD